MKGEIANERVQEIGAFLFYLVKDSKEEWQWQLEEKVTLQGNQNWIEFMLGEEPTYEIYGYMTSSDFEGRNFTVLDEGIEDKDEAMKLGEEYLEEYYKVKVQSTDREVIEILGGQA